MISAFIKSNSFQDSVSLMLISKKLSSLDSINLVSVMMGTPSNKDLFQSTGMWHDIFETATPNDICIAIDVDEASDEVVATISDQLDFELSNIASASKGKTIPTVRSWNRAKQLLPNANLALISVAGEYAAETALKALDLDLNVMLFSDNVSYEEELKLKKIAESKGLIVMGPDCGTALIKGVPLAFANKMPDGNIGIVGASGTGIQEVCSQIALLGGGITHAIGLGGRDLSEEIGGISAKSALAMLDQDTDTKVITFVSKPPSPQVREDIINTMQGLKKPVVAIFLGDKPKVEKLGNVYLTRTLDQAAKVAHQLSSALEFAKQFSEDDLFGSKIRGLYTGGTLAAESAMLLAEKLNLQINAHHPNGEMLNDQGHLVIDLGDDFYTLGRPHPMIEPSTRTDQIIDLKNENFGVLLLDVVLGFGGHSNPAGAVAEAVEELRRLKEKSFAVIATVTGTNEDPQDRIEQIRILEESGIKVVDTVPEAVAFCAILTTCKFNDEVSHNDSNDLLVNPKVINIGLQGFADDLASNKADAIHYRWSPIAGGNVYLANLINKLS